MSGYVKLLLEKKSLYDSKMNEYLKFWVCYTDSSTCNSLLLFHF